MKIIFVGSLLSLLFLSGCGIKHNEQKSEWATPTIPSNCRFAWAENQGKLDDKGRKVYPVYMFCN